MSNRANPPKLVFIKMMNGDIGAVEKREIASSLRSSQ